MKKEERRVVINADDFGQTESCTRAIAEAFEKGLITDTTMVANGEAMEQAFAYLERRPGTREKVGVHFILTEGRPLTEGIKNNAKFVREGHFNDFLLNRKNCARRFSRKDKKDLYEELTAQADYLIAQGIVPSHADSHHHIHYHWQIAPIVFRVCREHQISKLRIHRNVDKKSWFWNSFYAFFYNSRLRLHGFVHTDYFGGAGEYQAIRQGISEIMVHPDYDRENRLVDRRRKQPDDAVGFWAVGEPLEKRVERYLAEAQTSSYAALGKE